MNEWWSHSSGPGGVLSMTAIDAMVIGRFDTVLAANERNALLIVGSRLAAPAQGTAVGEDQFSDAEVIVRPFEK
jgi:hypothetical protein